MTRKEQIIEALISSLNETMRGRSLREWIETDGSDAILALPLDVPGDEEILKYAVDHNRTQKYTTIDYYATGRADGAKWMRSEIIKRNTP